MQRSEIDGIIDRFRDGAPTQRYLKKVGMFDIKKVTKRSYEWINTNSEVLGNE